MNKSLPALCIALGSLWIPPAVHAVEQVRVVALFPNKAMVSVDGTNRLLAIGSPSPEGLLLIAADSAEAGIAVVTGPDNRVTRLRAGTTCDGG